MITVVAGVLRDDMGRVMITQRNERQSQPLSWEFPGGKVEAGEKCEEALTRELREELCVETETGAFLHEIVSPDGRLCIRYYETKIVSGTLTPMEANDIRFAETGALSSFDMGQNDARFVKAYFKD